MDAISVETDEVKPQDLFPACRRPSVAGFHRGASLEAFFISDSLIGTTPVSTRALHGAPSQETQRDERWHRTPALTRPSQRETEADIQARWHASTTTQEPLWPMSRLQTQRGQPRSTRQDGTTAVLYASSRRQRTSPPIDHSHWSGRLVKGAWGCKAWLLRRRGAGRQVSCVRVTTPGERTC